MDWQLNHGEKTPMKPILTFMLTALLTTPLMAAAEGLKFKRHDEPNGMDDYTGQITVSGEYNYSFDDEAMGPMVCFTADKASAKLIPRKKGDERSPWFCFRNQATALKTFKIPKKPAKGYCEYRGKATVTVNQYSVYREASEGSDMAQLLGTKNIKSLSPKKCYVGY